MPGAAPPAGLSLYASKDPSPVLYPHLDGDIDAAVAVVGAGFTGLSTALHLAERGIKAVVIDRHAPGWGASGRNGGQVNPGLKHEPSEILRDFGPERGGRLLRLAGGAPDYVFGLIARHGIACEAIQSGTIRVVRSAEERGLIETSIDDWARHGVRLAWQDGAALAGLIGSPAYPAGLLDRRGGNLDPLAYARGLAAVATRAGARIFSDTPAESLVREGQGWRVRTPHGSIRAAKVVLATNGYTDGLWPGLAQTVIPVFSAIAATEKLPEALHGSILPGRQVVYESSWRVLYFRIDADGRLLMGGPSRLAEETTTADYDHLIRHAEALFPALKGVTWRHFWNGRVAVTKDHYPHLHEPAPGLFAGLGYNGRGVAMATVMGRLLAERIGGRAADELELPVSPIRPIRFHALWPAVVTARRSLGLLRDRIQSRH